MADPIDALLDEHALHRRLLSVFERIVHALGPGHPFPAQDLAKVLRYLREFVERAHHQKECAAVFPLALASADEAVAEVIGELIAEHDETHDLLQSLWLFWEPAELRDDERVVFIQIAMAYIARLRRHMDHEEHALFPSVRRLAPEERAQLLARYVAVADGVHGVADWSPVVADLEEHWVA